MKHFYISICIFIFIIASSIYSNFYTNTVLGDLSRNLNHLTDITEITEQDTKRVIDTKNLFFSKKNMLHLFVNKEHIEKIELDLLQLENNIQHDEIESVRENSIDIITALKYIKENMVAFD